MSDAMSVVGRSGASPAVADRAAVEPARAADAAEKFEAHFIAQMLKQMRRSVREINEGGERSFASRANDDMLEMADTFVADALAQQRAFGIADVILRQLVPAASSAQALGSSTVGAHIAPTGSPFRESAAPTGSALGASAAPAASAVRGSTAPTGSTPGAPAAPSAPALKGAAAPVAPLHEGPGPK